MQPADLEALVHKELRALPLPRAPYTLLPRVLAAVQEWSLRPWYTRAWFTWPRAGQVAALAVLIALTTTSVMLLPHLHALAAASIPETALVRWGDLAAVSGYVDVAITVGQAFWRTLIEPVVGYAFAVVVLMCFACAVLGTALNHVVLGRMLER